MNEHILEVIDLSVDFGGVRALDHLNLAIKPHEIVALIGPNGSGKTTFFNCLTGLYTPSEGEILFFPPESLQGINLIGMKPNQITEKGVARTFQNIRIFSQLTTLENVMIGRHCRTKAFILGALLRHATSRKEEQETIDKSYAILEKIGLADYVNELAGNLPYGAQRRLEIARALATEPFLLLLDEPAAGMNPQETLELVDLIKKISMDSLSILLIEHDMQLVMSLSDRIFVMDYGRMIAQGSPSEIRSNSLVIKAYLVIRQMLNLLNVQIGYGNILAIKDVSLEVDRGEIVALIGTNGAGKSTLLMAISGVAPCRTGRILLDGEEIQGYEPDRIVKMGVCQVPEGRHIFPQLTVRENLDMGAFLRRDKLGIKEDLEYVYSLFPILAERRNQDGGTLSGGEQQMLAMSRALMAKPRLLLAIRSC